MEIVKMTRDHTAALAELEQICFSRPWSKQSLDSETENPAAVFLTAVENGEVLGYCGMHCAAGECYMDNVAVFPQRREKGVATALLNALAEEARRRGGDFLSLEVRPSNVQAVKLYTSLGFREEGRRRNFYSSPTEDALLLTKRFRETS